MEVYLLANGLLARVFQHEIDHLDGILINSKGKRFTPQRLKTVYIKNEKVIG
jgi:peptide deformylase